MLNYSTQNGNDYTISWNKKTANVTCKYVEEIGNLHQSDIDEIIQSAMILGIEKVVLHTDCGVDIHSHTLKTNSKYKYFTIMKKAILAVLITIITLANAGCSKNGYGCHGNGKYITRVR